MFWTSYGLLALLLVVTFTVGFFGGHFGYVVSGVPVEPGSTSGLDWYFLYSLLLFRVDNMPAFISTIFLLIQVLSGFIIVKLVRGSD